MHAPKQILMWRACALDFAYYAVSHTEHSNADERRHQSGLWRSRWSDRLQPEGAARRQPAALAMEQSTPDSRIRVFAEGPTERQKRRKRRYATYKHQGGYQNVSVKPP